MRIGKGPDGLPCMIPGDFTAKIPQERYDSLEAASAAFIRPFDLENDRLFRAEIAIAEGRHYFLFDVHHIVFDGTSVKALIDDIAAAYDGRTLSEEALTLFDIAAYERTMKEGEAYRAAQAYFGKLLDGVDADSHPVSDVIEVSPEKGAGRVTLPLGEAVTIAQAENFVRTHGITESTLFLGAFAYALAKFNGAGDVQFCTVNNGRHDPRLAGSVGMFVKTLPVYLQFSDDESVSAYLKRTQEMLFDEMKHDCIRRYGCAGVVHGKCAGREWGREA